MATVSFARVAALAACAGLLGGLAGCSGSVPKTEVSGKILLNGKEPKVAGLQIAFVANDATTVSADIAEDGTYSATGVPAGEVKVFFTAVTEEQAQQVEQLKGKGPRLAKPGGSGPAPKAPAGGSHAKTNPIPEPLRTPTSSPLKTTLEAGKMNTFDYDIK